MQTNKFRFYWPLIIIATIFIVIADIACAKQLVISIQAEKIIDVLQGRNRISEYKVVILGARVYSVMKIPRDWWLKVKYMESPDIEAFAFHGAGFLGIEDIKKGIFDNFLVIETESDEGKFDIKISFTIDIFTEEEEKYILMEKKDLIINPYKP